MLLKFGNDYTPPSGALRGLKKNDLLGSFSFFDLIQKL